MTPEKEADLVAQLKERVSDLTKPESFDDNDHRYYTRWLIARDWNVEKAEAMIRKSMEFRAQYSCDSLVDTYETPEVLKKYYIGGVMGFDKDGSPVWLEPFTKLDSRGLLESVTREQVKLYKIHSCEQIMWLFKSQCAKVGKPVDQLVIVFDVEGLGWKHLYGPAVELFKEIIQIYEDNYPELLKKTYIVNAPKIFVLAYNLIKGVLSQRTTSKVHVLGAQWKTALLDVMDAHELPQAYGGTKIDENGDPYCSSQVLYGGEVPKKYYTASVSPSDDLPTVTIPRSSYKLIDYEISVNRCRLSYRVKSEKHDIGLGILYRPLHSDTSKPEKMETLVPIQRVNAHVNEQAGIIDCTQAGIYVLMLDNTFSWTKSKTVRYSVEVLPAVSSDQDSLSSALNMTCNDEPVSDFS